MLAAGKWNAKGHAQTGRLLQTLSDKSNNILYTDEAWWGDDKEQLPDASYADGVLIGIQSTLTNLIVAPNKIGDRYEQIGIHVSQDVRGVTSTHAGATGRAAVYARGSSNTGGNSSQPQANHSSGNDGRGGGHDRLAAQGVVARGLVGEGAAADGTKETRAEVLSTYRVTLTKNKGANAWMINAFEVHEDASGMDYGKPAPTEHHPYSARDGAGASSVASDSKQAAQAAKSDTQPHSRRGRGMGAESTSSLTKIGDIDKQSVDAGQQPATAADVQAIKSAATAAVGKKRAAKVEVLTRDEVGKRSGLERLIGDTSEQQQANGMRKATPPPTCKPKKSASRRLQRKSNQNNSG